MVPLMKERFLYDLLMPAELFTFTLIRGLGMIIVPVLTKNNFKKLAIVFFRLSIRSCPKFMPAGAASHTATQNLQDCSRSIFKIIPGSFKRNGYLSGYFQTWSMKCVTGNASGRILKDNSCIYTGPGGENLKELRFVRHSEVVNYDSPGHSLA